MNSAEQSRTMKNIDATPLYMSLLFFTVLYLSASISNLCRSYIRTKSKQSHIGSGMHLALSVARSGPAIALVRVAQCCLRCRAALALAGLVGLCEAIAGLGGCG